MKKKKKVPDGKEEETDIILFDLASESIAYQEIKNRNRNTIPYKREITSNEIKYNCVVYFDTRKSKKCIKLKNKIEDIATGDEFYKMHWQIDELLSVVECLKDYCDNFSNSNSKTLENMHTLIEDKLKGISEQRDKCERLILEALKES